MSEDRLDRERLARALETVAVERGEHVCDCGGGSECIRLQDLLADVFPADAIADAYEGEPTPDAEALRLTEDGRKWQAAETEGHVVTFSEIGYGLRHPPSCRPDLNDCRFNQWLANRGEPARKPGEYQMLWEGRSPTFALLAALREDTDGDL